MFEEQAVNTAFIGAGLVSILSAIVGGSVNFAGWNIPLIASRRRQILLGLFGCALLVLGTGLPNSLAQALGLREDPNVEWLISHDYEDDSEYQYRFERAGRGLKVKVFDSRDFQEASAEIINGTLRIRYPGDRETAAGECSGRMPAAGQPINLICRDGTNVGPLVLRPVFHERGAAPTP